MTEEVVEFPSALFALTAIKKAAYVVSDRTAVEMASRDGRHICKLHFDEDLSDTEIRKVVSDFRKEVLDQDLRRIVSEETAPMRNAIIAWAFSNTDLQSDD